MDAAKPTPAPARPAGPGLYADIGKKARDLLNRDYTTGQKFTFTTTAANGATITSSSTKKNEAILADLQTQVKIKNFTVDVKATSDSSVSSFLLPLCLLLA
uniref:Uncharacterized protein n=1 Tax=Triticum urartu TaxID=4572 RepID=A0A8R7K3X4_TRIUA